jgi:universal stress protein A
MFISRILVPTDFSADASAALDYAQALGRPFGASVCLLHVVENPLAAGVWSSDMYTAEIAGLQINLVRDAAERLQELVPAGAGWMTTEVRTGPAAREILAVAQERKADLIVMGTRGRTGLAHVLLGSVAERVVRMAPCPVLTLHAPAKAHAAVA